MLNAASTLVSFNRSGPSFFSSIINDIIITRSPQNGYPFMPPSPVINWDEVRKYMEAAGQ